MTTNNTGRGGDHRAEIERLEKALMECTDGGIRDRIPTQLLRRSSFVRAVCVYALVRISAGGRSAVVVRTATIIGTVISVASVLVSPWQARMRETQKIRARLCRSSARRPVRSTQPLRDVSSAVAPLDTFRLPARSPGSVPP
jgi:hypothetical protein